MIGRRTQPEMPSIFGRRAVRPPTLDVYDFSSGENTRDQDVSVTVRKARNVRLGRSGGFKSRPGHVRKGNQIGTGSGVLGLFSYVKKDNTAYLLSAWGTDIYKYSETGSGPATVASSTSSQATGYGKDRHLFFTATLDANGNPYLMATYQGGSGIILEWSAYPYTSWANSPITIDSSTQIGWDCHLGASDTLHVAFMSDANTTKYVPLSFGAGPTWTVGTKRTVAGSGASDRAFNPTVTVQSGGRIHVAYASYDGSQYVNKAKLSEDSGVTWSSSVTLGTPGASATYAVASILLSDQPYFVIQEDTTGAGTSYGYNQFVWNGSYLYQDFLLFAGTQTLNQFSLSANGSSVALYAASGAAPNGIDSTSVGGASNGNRRVFSVAVDGVNDSDVQYRNVVNGTEDISATRVSNDSSSNRFPAAAPLVPSDATYLPVAWTTGTVSPWTVKVNTSVQWISLSATLAASKNVEGAHMPNSGAGGTDSFYFVQDGTVPMKWDGSTLSSATATGYPAARHVVAFDNRLWLFGPNNRAYYTDLGSDNWAGTFPSGNTVDFPEYVLGGYVYRDRTLLVFTVGAIYYIQNFDYTGATVGPEQVNRIPNSYGTLSIRSVHQIGYWVYFQSPDGMVRRTNSQYVEEPACSDVVRPTLEGLSLSRLSVSAAGSVRDYYMVTGTSQESGSPDTVCVLDTAKAPTAGWSFDTGKSLSVFASHPDGNGVPLLYSGDAASGTVYSEETGTSDSGTAIPMDLETGILFGGGFYGTVLRDTMVAASSSVSGTLTVGIAPFENSDSFSTQDVPLSDGSSVWGVGTWGDGRTWGGDTSVQAVLPWNRTSAGWKLRFSSSESDVQVGVLGTSVTYLPSRNTV